MVRMWRRTKGLQNGKRLKGLRVEEEAGDGGIRAVKKKSVRRSEWVRRTEEKERVERLKGIAAEEIEPVCLGGMFRDTRTDGTGCRRGGMLRKGQ